MASRSNGREGRACRGGGGATGGGANRGREAGEKVEGHPLDLRDRFGLYFPSKRRLRSGWGGEGRGKCRKKLVSA